MVAFQLKRYVVRFKSIQQFLSNAAAKSVQLYVFLFSSRNKTPAVSNRGRSGFQLDNEDSLLVCERCKGKEAAREMIRTLETTETRLMMIKSPPSMMKMMRRGGTLS